MVAGQKVALGRVHAGKTVTIHVTDTELAIASDDGTRIVRRTTDQPVRNLKASDPARRIQNRRKARCSDEKPLRQRPARCDQ
ncbi:hypothetical protein AB0880_27225 [Micromonospora chersina]|uniref:hypothetical protein n=1 Tax=Micromonospora chersina TaxID=47854 RepID=UPI003452047C